MAMFAIALKPLHDELKSLCKQAWFADDGTGCDTFIRMRSMIDALLERGPLYGYFMQPKKCILVVKEGRGGSEEVLWRNGNRDVLWDEASWGSLGLSNRQTQIC